MESKRIIDFRYAPDDAQVCIGLVDDPYKTLVRDDGSLCFGYDAGHDPYYYFRLQQDIQSRMVQNHGFKYRYRPYVLHQDTLMEVKQDFGKPTEAIVETIQLFENSTATWRCFAWQKDEETRIDVISWRLTAGEAFKRTRSGIVLQVLGEEFTVYSTERQMVHLEAGQTMEGAFFIVHSGEFTKSDATLENEKKAYDWCKKYWNEIKPFTKAFSIPDKQIEEMLLACGRNILQAREIKGNVPTYQVGPTVYRGLWIVDGLFFLDAVHIMGRSKEAYEGMLAVLRHVHPDGSISAIPFHEKETAFAVFTFVRQCSLMQDDERFIELWPTIVRAFNFLKSRVEASKKLGEGYKGYGLYPPSYGDGGLNGLEPEYTTPLWVMTGIHAAAKMGKRLNLSHVNEMEKLVSDMMTYFRKAYTRDRKTTQDGIHYLPMSMLSQDEYMEHLENADFYNKTGEVCNIAGYTPQCGTWALAQSIAPGELFTEADMVVKDLLNLLENCDKEEGIPKNTGWMTEEAVWAYSSMFYAEVFLHAGRGEKAADYLYAFANHACAGRCWREEQALRNTNSRAIWGDMPHNWGSAEFIRLVRNMIILEKEESLELLAGLPDEWLPTEENELYIEDSPTKFGCVSVRLTRNDGKYHLDYCIKGDRKPNQVIIKSNKEFVVTNTIKII